MRFNRARVRQPMTIRQAHLTLSLVQGLRRDSFTIALSGGLDEDFARAAGARSGRCARPSPVIPDDPYLLYSTEPSSSDRIESGLSPAVAGRSARLHPGRSQGDRSGRALCFGSRRPRLCELAWSPPLPRGREFSVRLVALPLDGQGREPVLRDLHLGPLGAPDSHRLRARGARAHAEARPIHRSGHVPGVSDPADVPRGADRHVELGRRVRESSAHEDELPPEARRRRGRRAPRDAVTLSRKHGARGLRSVPSTKSASRSQAKSSSSPAGVTPAQW